MMIGQSSKFVAKLVELTALDNVKRVRYGESVPNMFISNMELLHMKHVDAKNMTNYAMEEGRNFLANVCSEGPGFATIECCVDWDGQEDLSFGL